MLAGLRKHSRSVVIYVLFGIIIVVFVFTFNMGSADVGCPGSGKRVSDGLLAQVGNVPVDGSLMAMGLALTADPPAPSAGFDPKAFQAEMMYRSSRFARLRGDPKYGMFIADPRQVPDLKTRKVADDLTETLLVSQAAEKAGLRASPEEIKARILKEFTDPSTNQFRKKSYENYVRYGLRTSLGRFEEFVGREILREKMIDLVTAGVAMSDREAKYVAARRKASRSYEYLEVDPQALAEALAPTPAEVTAWLATHGEDAKKWFDAHAAEYKRPEAYDYHVISVQGPSRRILAQVEAGEQRTGLETARAEAKARAQEAEKAVQGLKGDDLVKAFEAAAARYSDDSLTKGRGGRVEAPLPAQSVAALTDPAVAAALQRLQPRTASGIVEGDNGFYLVLLQGVQPAQERTYDQVKDEVAAQILSGERAKAKVDAVAADVLARVQAGAGRSLADIAAEANVPYAPATPVQVGETGAVAALPGTLSGLATFTPGQVPGLGDDPALVSALEALTLDKPVVDKAFPVAGDRRAVIRLKAAAAMAEATPEEVEAARAEFLPLKKQGLYREWYNGLRSQAAAAGTLAEKEPLQAMIRDEARAREEALTAKLNPKNGKAPVPPAPEDE
jgi:peptidyl-prolyl cis-trans isomerase D